MRTKPESPPTVRGESPEVPWAPPQKRRPPVRWRPTRLTKKLVALSKQFLAPSLTACIIVLGTAAAGSGDADWELVIPGQPPICVKSEEACYQARDAINRGNWIPVGGVAAASYPYIDCRPHPSCFGDRANCIPGYAGSRSEGYCR